MFSPGHLQSAEQHNSAVMTGNPTGAGGVDYGVRSVAGAGGYPSRAAQAYHGGGIDAGTGFSSYGASNTVESMKGFECSDLDNALLGSGGLHSTGGNEGQMYLMPNRTVNTNSANMGYSEYGQSNTDTEGFGYNHVSRSHAYNNQYMSGATYGRQTRGVNSMNSSTHQHLTNSDYSAEGMTRRMSVPAADNNTPTQSYVRSNSYPIGTPYENSHQHFPPSSQSYPMSGYNQTAYPDMDTTASNMATGQMNRRTQANSFMPSYASGSMKKPSYPSSASSNESWADSGYSAQSKFPPHSSMSKGGHSVDSVESNNLYPQFQHGAQNSASMQGMQYGSSRPTGCTYPSSNVDMTPNHYSSVANMDMCTPSSTSVNYSNKGAKPFSGANQLRQSSAYSQTAFGHLRSPGYKTATDAQTTAMGQSSLGGASQRLRHYGPMPNQTQGAHHLPYRGYNSTDTAVSSGESAVTPNMHGQYQQYEQYSGATSTRHERMRSLDGRFMSGSSSVQTGMATSATFPVPAPNQRPFDTVTPQQNVAPPSFGNANLGYYNNRTKSDAFSPSSMQSTGCQEMYNQNYVEGPQRYNTATSSNVMGHANCPPAYQMHSEPAQTEADIRRNMIFSAELEKLARLSRDPMADDFPGGISAIGGASETQEAVGSLTQSVKNPHYPNAVSGSMPLGLFSNQAPSSAENSTGLGKSYQSPPASVSSITTSQSVKMTSVQSSSLNDTHAAALSAPSTPSANAGITQQTSPDTICTKPVQTSAPANSSTPTPTTVTSQDKEKDSQNAVQQLQRLTQSLKDKKDDGTKGSHMEYLSHSSESASSLGGQNCIAALSAACRNMIADMDSSVPKLAPTSHSPLGMKSVLDNTGSGLGQKYTPTQQSQTSYSSQIPDQMFSPPNANGQNISPPLVSMSDSFGSPPYSTASVPPDYQMQFGDFLEQSVPMPMNTRRPEEKPRKKGKRKKSDEVSDMLTASTIGPKKRRGRKKSSQNPLSVESFDQPPSLENFSASTPMSDGQLPLVEENPSRSATHTPNMLSNSWRINDTKLHSSESMPNVLSNQQPGSVDSDSVTQDFLDSVFSPDTTMSTTNQEPVDSFSQLTSTNQSHHSPASSLTSQQSMNETASTGSYSSQGGLITRNNQNYQIDNMDQSKLVLNQAVKASKTSNSTVSSTGDLMSNPVSTSSDTTDANSEKSAAEEVHPLEILQAQIQLQRQQFNLNDSRPLPLKTTTRKAVGSNATKKTGPSSVQGEVDVNVLMAEEDATWYMPNEQPKEPEVPWENMRKSAKGQQQGEISPVDRRTQNKLLEQKRRDSLKNSIDNLKNALPDGRNLTDQTQQSVLLKAQNYIKDMLGKQQRSKTCLEDIESLKSKNNTIEDNIVMLKQEYDILSNME